MFGAKKKEEKHVNKFGKEHHSPKDGKCRSKVKYLTPKQAVAEIARVDALLKQYGKSNKSLNNSAQPYLRALRRQAAK